MKSLFFLLFALLPSFVVAGNGDDRLGLRTGFLLANTGTVHFNYEREVNYGNVYELFGEMGAKQLTTRQPKDYYWATGLGYKWSIHRYKNSVLRFTTEVHGGAHVQQFYFGGGAGLEYAYVFPNGVQFVIQQKNQINFLHNGNFKHGLLLGLQIPL